MSTFVDNGNVKILTFCITMCVLFALAFRFLLQFADLGAPKSLVNFSVLIQCGEAGWILDDQALLGYFGDGQILG